MDDRQRLTVLNLCLTVYAECDLSASNLLRVWNFVQWTCELHHRCIGPRVRPAPPPDNLIFILTNDFLIFALQ